MGDGKDELRARFRDSVNEDDTDTPGNTGGPDNSGDSDNSGNTGGSGDLGDTGDSGNSDSDSAAGETEDTNNTSNPGNSGRMGHTQNPSTTEMEDDGEVDEESGEVGNPGNSGDANNSGDAGNTSGAAGSRHTSVPGPDPDPQSLRSERSQYPLYLTEEFQTHINKQYTLEKAERMEDVNLEKHKHFLEAVVRAGLDHDDLEEYIDAQLERY